MAKLGNIFNKEEIKKEEQHPRRTIKWIHYSKLKENVEQYCPAGRMYVILIFYTDCPSSFTQSFSHFSINAGHRRISSERKWLI